MRRLSSVGENLQNSWTSPDSEPLCRVWHTRQRDTIALSEKQSLLQLSKEECKGLRQIPHILTVIESPNCHVPSLGTLFVKPLCILLCSVKSTPSAKYHARFINCKWETGYDTPRPIDLDAVVLNVHGQSKCDLATWTHFSLVRAFLQSEHGNYECRSTMIGQNLITIFGSAIGPKISSRFPTILSRT